MPPSTSISTSSPRSSIIRRSRRILSSALGMNGCPPKPGFTDITSTMRDVAQHALDRLERRVRVQHDARPLAELADLPDRAVQVRARLDVHADEVRAGLRVRGDPALGVLDHQVHVERQGRRAPHRLDHDRADRQVRHEVAVHHVDVDVVRRARSRRPPRRAGRSQRTGSTVRCGSAARCDPSTRRRAVSSRRTGRSAGRRARSRP